MEFLMNLFNFTYTLNSDNLMVMIICAVIIAGVCIAVVKSLFKAIVIIAAFVLLFNGSQTPEMQVYIVYLQNYIQQWAF